MSLLETQPEDRILYHVELRQDDHESDDGGEQQQRGMEREQDKKEKEVLKEDLNSKPKKRRASTRKKGSSIKSERGSKGDNKTKHGSFLCPRYSAPPPQSSSVCGVNKTFSQHYSFNVPPLPSNIHPSSKSKLEPLHYSQAELASLSISDVPPSPTVSALLSPSSHHPPSESLHSSVSSLDASPASITPSLSSSSYSFFSSRPKLFLNSKETRRSVHILSNSAKNLETTTTTNHSSKSNNNNSSNSKDHNSAPTVKVDVDGGNSQNVVLTCDDDDTGKKKTKAQEKKMKSLSFAGSKKVGSEIRIRGPPVNSYRDEESCTDNNQDHKARSTSKMMRSKSYDPNLMKTHLYIEEGTTQGEINHFISYSK